MSNRLSTPAETRVRLKIADTVIWPSNFDFVREHNGHRPGKIHMYLGIAGGGKSTLVRSLVIDALENNKIEKPIALWLSEEAKSDFEVEFSRSGYADEKRLEMFSVSSELDHNYRDPKHACHEYVNYLDQEKPGIVIFDNLTTSQMYMGVRPEEQDRVMRWLKRIHSERDIALILIMHTGKGISDTYSKLIEPSDVRGSGSATNLVEFLYIIQGFHIGSRWFQTIRICKSRGQQVSDRYFQLVFSDRARMYCQSAAIQFEKFKEQFKNRNTL